jgi:hemoglobin/transferrin/lactoferrin receptor protein
MLQGFRQSMAAVLMTAVVVAAGDMGRAGKALAGEEPVVMDRVVVTARGTPTRLSETPGGVGVLDAEEISMVQPISISDALTRIPGVSISEDSPWGGEVNIRGLGRGRIVFLIDGVRMNTATDINAQFGLIDPNEIERVEVLKGPISALYGSGSIGGVVNIITKKGMFADETAFHGTLTGTYKSNPDGYGGYANLSGNAQRAWAYASGGYRDYSSYKDGGGETINNSQFEDFNGAFKVGYRWNELHRTRFQYQQYEGRDIGIPGTGSASLPTVADVTYPETTRMLASIVHEFFPESPFWTESSLNLYFQEIDRNVRIDKLPPASGVRGIEPSANHKTWGLRWFNGVDVGDHSLGLGADVWLWDIESERKRNFLNGNQAIDQPMADASLLSGGVFIEDNWKLQENLALNLGGRVDLLRAKSDALNTWVKPPSPNTPNPALRDEESTTDHSWAAHAGLTWGFLENWSMTLLGSSSYRAPDLMERFKYINLGSYEVFGNPDLDPERSLYAEYGLHYNLPNLTASLSAFANRLNDLIVEKQVAPNRHELHNVDKAEIFGGEASLEWRFFQEWSAYATLAYAVGKNRTEKTDLESMPPLNGLVGVRYNQGLGWNGLLELEWADRQSKVAPGEKETPGWATVNARVGYRFLLRQTTQELALVGSNLLDETYRNHLATGRKPAELNSLGRSIAVTWKMEF